MIRFSLLSTTALAFCAALALSACGGGGGGPKTASSTGGQPSGSAVGQGGGGNLQTPGNTGTRTGDSPAGQSSDTSGNPVGQTDNLVSGTGDAVSEDATPTREAALRHAIETVGTGAPGTLTISRPDGSKADIWLDASWRTAGSAPVAPTTIRYSGQSLTRMNAARPTTAWVYTDIQPPRALDFTEVWPLDTDTDADQQNDALGITAAHLRERLVTHVSRLPDDTREGDTDSVNPVNRGVSGEDRNFDRGHEIDGRFDGAYGIYSCVAETCSLNDSGDPRKGITAMAGWVFTPKSYTGAGGGSRKPQVSVPDTDYRWFGFWLRGPDPLDDGAYEMTTFAGGSQPFAGDPRALSGRATYEGPAAGQYVKEGADGSASAGVFTAKVTLHADFGSSQTIHGGLGGFRGGGRDLGWSLSFDSTSIASSGGFSGRTHGATWDSTYKGTDGYRDEGQDNHGRFSGRFYGDGADGAYPTGAAGTFTGKFDDGAVAGGFGTYLMVTQPEN